MSDPEIELTEGMKRLIAECLERKEEERPLREAFGEFMRTGGHEIDLKMMSVFGPGRVNDMAEAFKAGWEARGEHEKKPTEEEVETSLKHWIYSHPEIDQGWLCDARTEAKAFERFQDLWVKAASRGDLNDVNKSFADGMVKEA